MKIIKIAVPTLTLIIIASQLFGAPATTQDETLQMIQRNEMIEIEIAVPKDQEQGAQSQLVWEELASLITYNDTLRIPMEKELNVTFNEEYSDIKVGMIYQTNSGKIIQNNTLKGALQNNNFRAAVDNDETISTFSDAACNTFCDLESDEEMTNFHMAINAYFNLLPTTEEGYTNPQNVLTRAQFMSLVIRAEAPVDKSIKVDEAFSTAVGESEYNLYAQHLADYSYLNLSDKSLNNQTYNGNISRGEAIYMLMSKYYADELKAVDTSKANLDDTKDGGDIATTQGYTKDYGKSYEIVYVINNPEAGVPTDIYKALVLAEQKGLIDSETRFDEAITLEESVELLVNIYKTLPIEEESEQLQQGEIIINDSGSISQGGYDYGKSGLEMEEDGKDGIVGGTIMYNEDNTTYVLWDDGRIFYPGDTLPDGVTYGGATEEDHQKLAEEAIKELEELGYFD